MIDTLKTARDLRTAGLPQEQAEAVAHAISEAQQSQLADLATKGDLQAVKSDLQVVKAELKSDIEILRRDLTIKLSGMIVVATGVLLAAIRYLPPSHP